MWMPNMAARSARHLAEDTAHLGMAVAKTGVDLTQDVTKGVLKSTGLMAESIDDGSPQAKSGVDGQLDFNEFEHLLKGPMLKPFLPGADWRDLRASAGDALLDDFLQEYDGNRDAAEECFVARVVRRVEEPGGERCSERRRNAI